MGGGIEVESRVGAGTTFVLNLPFVEGKAQQASRATQDFQGENLGLKVLAVDDNETNLFLLEQLVLRMGCEVVRARESP